MNIDSKIQFLKKIGCDEVGHKNQTLLDHLIGVYNILKSWDAPEYVQDAGLFHSVYGTTYFKPQMITSREMVKELIGDQAEILAYLFCIISAPRLQGILKIEDEHVKKDLLLIDKANVDDMASVSMMTWEEAYNV